MPPAYRSRPQLRQLQEWGLRLVLYSDTVGEGQVSLCWDRESKQLSKHAESRTQAPGSREPALTSSFKTSCALSPRCQPPQTTAGPSTTA